MSPLSTWNFTSRSTIDRKRSNTFQASHPTNAKNATVSATPAVITANGMVCARLPKAANTAVRDLGIGEFGKQDAARPPGRQRRDRRVPGSSRAYRQYRTRPLDMEREEA